MAVDAGVAGRVLEGAADLGDVAERHHAFAALLDRQRIDVGGALDEAGNLDVEAALTVVQEAGGDKLVVVRQRGQQLLLGDLVGLQLHAVDDDLEQLLPVTGKIGAQHGRKPPRSRPSAAGRAGRACAPARRRTAPRRSSASGRSWSRRPSVRPPPPAVRPWPGRPCRGHRPAPWSLSKSTLNSSTTPTWPSPETVVISFSPSRPRSAVSIGRAISRSASPGETPCWADRDVEHRNVDVRVGLFRHADIGHDAGRDHHHHQGENGLRPPQDRLEHRDHCAAPAMVGHGFDGLPVGHIVLPRDDQPYRVGKAADPKPVGVAAEHGDRMEDHAVVLANGPHTQRAGIVEGQDAGAQLVGALFLERHARRGGDAVRGWSRPCSPSRSPPGRCGWRGPPPGRCNGSCRSRCRR